MTRKCCTGETAQSRFARPFGKATASIVPGALLVLLPKCPLCLAAWLTLVTGVSFPVSGVRWVREMLVVSWITAIAIALASIIQRRVIRSSRS